ncbi:MAG: DUF2520 domain-containing protein [Dehalococcoidales bacterium]
MANDTKIGFIGAGALANTLAVALKQKGFKVAAVSCYGSESAKALAKRIGEPCLATDNQGVADSAEVVFIATPDDVIATVAMQIKWHKGQKVIHCSGADSIDILRPAEEFGAQIGAFHPLQTFAAGLGENLKGITFAVEAQEPLLAQLKELALTLGGNWLELKSEDRVIYHAAAVFAANYMITLTNIAADLWDNIGISREKAIEALLPLIRGTLNNMQEIGITDSLTGPIARGDSGTIEKHIKALGKINSDLKKLYAELGLNTIPIASEKGRLDKVHAAQIERLLKDTIQQPEYVKK